MRMRIAKDLSKSYELLSGCAGHYSVHTRLESQGRNEAPLKVGAARTPPIPPKTPSFRASRTS